VHIQIIILKILIPCRCHPQLTTSPCIGRSVRQLKFLQERGHDFRRRSSRP
jgi:hypothetical protein